MKKLWALAIFSTSLMASGIALPENFKAHFIQKITNPDKKVIQYSGSVRFSDEKMLKWTYEEPTKKEVCTNGVNVTIVDHDLEQVAYYLMEKGLDLASILKKAKPYKQQKTVFLADYESKQYTVQIDTKGRLSRVAYFDELDNQVLIIFDAMTYGKGKLPLESMLCKAPEAYDVIGE